MQKPQKIKSRNPTPKQPGVRKAILKLVQESRTGKVTRASMNEVVVHQIGEDLKLSDLEQAAC